MFSMLPEGFLFETSILIPAIRPQVLQVLPYRSFQSLPKKIVCYVRLLDSIHVALLDIGRVFFTLCF